MTDVLLNVNVIQSIDDFFTKIFSSLKEAITWNTFWTLIAGIVIGFVICSTIYGILLMNSISKKEKEIENTKKDIDDDKISNIVEQIKNSYVEESEGLFRALENLFRGDPFRPHQRPERFPVPVFPEHPHHRRFRSQPPCRHALVYSFPSGIYPQPLSQHRFSRFRKPFHRRHVVHHERSHYRYHFSSSFLRLSPNAPFGWYL